MGKFDRRALERQAGDWLDLVRKSVERATVVPTGLSTQKVEEYLEDCGLLEHVVLESVYWSELPRPFRLTILDRWLITIGYMTPIESVLEEAAKYQYTPPLDKPEPSITYAIIWPPWDVLQEGIEWVELADGRDYDFYRNHVALQVTIRGLGREEASERLSELGRMLQKRQEIEQYHRD